MELNLKTSSTKEFVDECRDTKLLKNEAYVLTHFKKEDKILDVGCGTGRESITLSKMGYNFVAIDYSEELIKQAKQDYPHIDFRVMDLRKLDFEDSLFDVVWIPFTCIDYLESKKGVLQGLNEAKRVLRTNGLLVFSSHNSQIIPTTYHLIKVNLRNCFRSAYSNFWIENHKFGKLKLFYYSQHKWKKLLEKNGFLVEKVLGSKWFDWDAYYFCRKK